MPDGTTIVAVSFDDADPYARDEPPDFGLYLDRRWSPPWPHARLDWPDFGLPDHPDGVIVALTELLRRAQNHEHVEIGCVGAHGRTGTALAVAAILCGVAPDDAVAWVRTTYCDRAIETAEQEAFVAAIERDDVS
jgi:protein-tyrosine phosphatase